VPITKAGKEFLGRRNFRWIRPIIDLAMSGSSDLAVQDETLVGYHFRITDSFESQIDLDDYQKAVDVLPPLAQGKAEGEEVQVGVKRWFDGPQTTGSNFAGTWETKFTWDPAQSATDTLRVYQCGDFVLGKTVPGSGKWDYTLSGTVQGNALIGAWKSPRLQGNFLLIMSKENGTVSGHWVGTGDAKPYVGHWSWERKDE
jgi:hypothetical protein